MTNVVFLVAMGLVQFQEPPVVKPLKYCTLLACRTEAVVDIRRADLETPNYEVLVEFDNIKQRCVLPKSEDVSPEVANCGDVVRLVHRPVPCKPSQDERSCVLTPKVEEHLAIFATPETITVTLFQDGKVIGTGTMHPIYASRFPNGKECDEGCKSWRTIWTIPGE